MEGTCGCNSIIPIVLVHGGAGKIPDHKLQEQLDGVKLAAKRAHQVLMTSRNALDAVENAIQIMESNDKFNCGVGSSLNRDGQVEMDASIMQGNLKCGAVAYVKDIVHPISLARLVMDSTCHIIMAGQEAMKFAAQMQIPPAPPDSLITKEAREAHKNCTCLDKTGERAVGAVAIDSEGRVAAATSTGGVSGKLPGLGGCASQIGHGIYADNQFGAVSCTGHGESIIKSCLAYNIARNLNSQCNAEKVVRDKVDEMQDKFLCTGGAIVVTSKGQVGVAFGSTQMPWAYIRDKELHFGIQPKEHVIEVDMSCADTCG